jgi:hypothetical protein
MPETLPRNTTQTCIDTLHSILPPSQEIARRRIESWRNDPLGLCDAAMMASLELERAMPKSREEHEALAKVTGYVALINEIIQRDGRAMDRIVSDKPKAQRRGRLPEFGKDRLR